jgi:hypothetical protein
VRSSAIWLVFRSACVRSDQRGCGSVILNHQRSQTNSVGLQDGVSFYSHFDLINCANTVVLTEVSLVTTNLSLLPAERGRRSPVDAEAHMVVSCGMLHRRGGGALKVVTREGCLSSWGEGLCPPRGLAFDRSKAEDVARREGG